MSEREIIEGCRKGNAESRRALYETYSPVMYGICRRYVPDPAQAEDLLHDGFITVFTKIADYRGEGSFEGWCKRIFVNTALGYLRKQKMTFDYQTADDYGLTDNSRPGVEEGMSAEEILSIIRELPDGYRTVVNLYAVEGYSHKEIAEMLDISEVTSRTQYSRARARLMEEIKKRYI